MMRGRKHCFSFSLPWRMIVLPTMSTPLPGCGAPQRDCDSVRMKSEIPLVSWPPYYLGQ